MTLIYLLVGLFIVWTVTLFLTAKTENYIESLVETMRKDEEI
jgi:uncharacterized membrane protein YuzA (DUF378 family)